MYLLKCRNELFPNYINCKWTWRGADFLHDWISSFRKLKKMRLLLGNRIPTEGASSWTLQWTLWFIWPCCLWIRMLQSARLFSFFPFF